jgi:hypothetical protein
MSSFKINVTALNPSVRKEHRKFNFVPLGTWEGRPTR